MGHPPVPLTDADVVAVHLDRAWDHLDRGELAAAVRSADTAAECAPELPEVRTLQGAIAAAHGDTHGALAHYAAAIEADPDYPSPILQSAELYLYSLDEPDRARELVDRARELVEEDDELADAVLLTAEIELARGDADAARAAMQDLRGVSIAEPALHCRAGQMWFDLDELEEADRHFQAAIAEDESLADAHHGLGLVGEARGDVAAMRHAWLTTRKLDLESPPAPWHIEAAEFESIAETALAELPERVRALLENVPIMVVDYPSVEIIAEGHDPRMLGFFAGVPYPEKPNVGGGQTHPDCVFLYQKNIENACRGREELIREIRITLWHETAHFFGLDDEQLGEIGLG
jgi:predicted Zn-dependent protease with MMP-like domain/Flp pilus assembly protein TadD